MFLEFDKVIFWFMFFCLSLIKYIFSGFRFIDTVFNFIETHSVLVGIITAVVTSSLWMRKYISQKRAEAFFDFYTQLLLKTKYLKCKLTEFSQIDFSEKSKGNIYSLLYTDNTIFSICEGYNKPEPAKLKILSDAADNLKECIIKSDCNVYPRNANRKKWYDSQHVVLSFCEFIIEVNTAQKNNNRNDEMNNGLHNIYNTSKEDNNKIPIHRVKCKEFVDAMDYIITSIENEKY